MPILDNLLKRIRYVLISELNFYKIGVWWFYIQRDAGNFCSILVNT